MIEQEYELFTKYKKAVVQFAERIRLRDIAMQKQGCMTEREVTEDDFDFDIHDEGYEGFCLGYSTYEQEINTNNELTKGELISERNDLIMR